MSGFEELAARFVRTLRGNEWRDEVIRLSACLAATFEERMNEALEYCIVLAQCMSLQEYSAVLAAWHGDARDRFRATGVLEKYGLRRF